MAGACKHAGADPGPLSWVLRAQGDGAALLALSALQPHLRQQLVQQGALRGLAALLHSTSAQQGLAAQVRVTAAAALVPLLGELGGNAGLVRFANPGHGPQDL